MVVPRAPVYSVQVETKFSKWSYDNILIDWVWPGRTGKYLARGLGASINKYIALLCVRSPKRLETTKLKDLIGHGLDFPVQPEI